MLAETKSEGCSPFANASINPDFVEHRFSWMKTIYGAAL